MEQVVAVSVCSISIVRDMEDIIRVVAVHAPR